MKLLRYFIIGIFFGIVMTKSEAASWFRIQEMFLFDSFHMYGIIGTAVIFGAIIVWSLKYFNVKTIDQQSPKFKVLPNHYIQYIAGGTIFGLGWAMTGACPGPIYVLIGQGFVVMILVLISAVFGALVYGSVRHKLPH